MDEVTSALGDIHRSMPRDIQDEIDVIAAKHPRGTEIPAALNDNQKRWLVVGICLHSVISPVLRKYVESILKIFHDELIRNYQVDTQIYPTHLQRDPHTGFFLNYEAINNNKVKYGKNIAKYDYTINDALDLSKLFLQTHMAHYTGFDDTCDSSAMLALILNIAKFDPVIKSDADDVRKHIRNPWAHCDFTDWDAGKYSNSFQLTKKLVNDLKLSLSEEKPILEEMEKWEINGQRFLSGSTHGLELVNELHQQTHVLALYAKLVATEADNSFMKIKNELEKFEIIFNKIAQLDNDMKQGICEIDKILMIQDKTLKIHKTEIKKLGDNLSKCACQDNSTVEKTYNGDVENYGVIVGGSVGTVFVLLIVVIVILCKVRRVGVFKNDTSEKTTNVIFTKSANDEETSIEVKTPQHVNQGYGLVDQAKEKTNKTNDSYAQVQKVKRTEDTYAESTNGEYDHLHNIDGRKLNSVENTYDSNAGVRNRSDPTYDTATSSSRVDMDNTYDHSFTNLKTYSEYDVSDSRTQIGGTNYDTYDQAC